MAARIGTVDTDNEASGGETAQALSEGPGGLLRQAREARKLSCQEVAAYLRLTPAIIDALERNDYTRLPGSTFARGYLRGYARYLGISESGVLDAYERLGVPEPVRPAAHPKVRKQLRSTDRRVRSVTYIIVALVIILSLLWWRNEVALRLWQPEEAQPPVAEPQSPGGQPETPATNSAPVSDQPVQPEAGAGVADTLEPVGQGAQAPSPTTGDTPSTGLPATGSSVEGAGSAAAVPVPPAEPAEPPQQPAAQEQPAADDGQDTLVLRFSEDSWVDVKDRDGNRVLYGLMRAKDTRKVSGKPPFSLVLGNAPGVSVEINGQPFDNSPFRTGKVARFAIGSPDHGE